MDDISRIIDICDTLLQTQNNFTTKTRPIKKTISAHDIEQEPIDEVKTINQIDIENLSNYVQIWTDIIDTDDVLIQFNKSEFSEIKKFEEVNYLYNVGFFYVKINPKLSPLEFFGLLSKIPFETMRLPGLNQISFPQLIQVFGEHSDKVVIQLMSLGDFFKFWVLVNPYTQMKKTHSFTKLMLSGMGSLTIYISPNFLRNCKEMIENVDLHAPTK